MTDILRKLLIMPEMIEAGSPVNEFNRYPVDVFWSEEVEGFLAVVADLPGCSAFGKTKHEALTELQSAIIAWVGATRAAGNPIPDLNIDANS